MDADLTPDISGPSSGFKYKYPAGHKYHRSKDDMARDLSSILALPLCHKTKVDVINSFLWGWSELFGKYGGCRHSVKAAEHADKHGQKDLVHDHSVPRKVVTDMILGTTKPTAEQLLAILEEYCEGVIITKDEDAALNKAGLRSTMPKDWNGTDPDARYIAVGIAIEERVY